MKILYWTERFWPHIGGVEVLSEQLIPALQQKGHQFCIVTSHSAVELPDTDTFADVPIHRFHFLTALTNNDLPQLIQTRRRLEQLKREYQPDLVHIHFSGPSAWFHWQTVKAWSAPTVVTFHSVPTQLRKANSLLTNTLQRADWVNTVSRFMLDDLRELTPTIRDKSSVIYNGITLSAVDSPLPFDPPTLLCIGRLVDWKGFDVALHALAKLRTRYPELTMTIAGDGPALDALQTLCDQLGLRQAVTFSGWVDRAGVAALLAQATVVIIPSRADENLPVVAIEAGLAGRPIVASKLSGLPEIVDDGETGFLVLSADSDEFAQSIDRLLQDQTRTVAFGVAAAAKIGEQFSLDACVNAYDQLFKQLQEV